MFRVIYVSVFSACFLCSSAHASLQVDKCLSEQHLLHDALEIAYERNLVSKRQMAYEFIDSVNSIPDAELARLSDDTIDGIAMLLREPDYWVKVYAAMALGVIGPRAARALPQLQETSRSLVEPLKAGQVVLPSLDGKKAVRSAIAHIQGVEKK